MNAHLLEIIVFKKDLEKNNIELKEGLNIITGNSKTGKSALLEIVDYCLLNSQNCIPKGIIDNECILFVIVLKKDNKKIVIARQPYRDGYNGKRNSFLSIENEDFNEKKLNYDYFIKKKDLYRPISEISSLFLKELGVKVEKRIFYEGESKRKKISLRNISSYIFQQQNLIANKYALFYRFEDSLKRKSAIEEFPIFTGMIDQRYYELQTKLENIRKRLMKEEKNKNIHIQEKKYLIEKKEFLENELLSFLKAEIKNGEDILIDEEKIASKVDKLETEIEEIQKKLIQNNLRVNNLKRSLNNFKDIGKEIERVSNIEINENNNCPICKNKLITLNEKASLLLKNKEKLTNLFVKRNKDTSSIYMKINELEFEKVDLIKIKEELKLERDKILVEIFSEEKKNIRRIIFDKKIEVDLVKEKIDSIEKDFKSNNLSLEEKEAKEIEKEISKYRLGDKIKIAESKISEEMSRIAKEFDFEVTLGKPNFKIDLKEFDVYQELSKEKIFISSMGSGSNWLTVHLSLFLALNYYFCYLGKKCSVPPILFLDQPSQVYFPDKINEDSEDFKKVEKIYKTILEEINYTKERTGITPQIIIVDHADKLNLGENEDFESYIKARWKTKGAGFIKNKNSILV